MNTLQKISKRLLGKPSPWVLTEPEEAYNAWASGYDNQPGNLMLYLDEQIFTVLLSSLSLHGKTVADIGCGTGRYWQKLYSLGVADITGFDVAENMLNRLLEKYPGAKVHKISSTALKLESNSCDLVISTLTLAHITNIETAFNEWNRVLKPGGYLIITDYHPGLLLKGGDRTFKHGDKTIFVVNHVHSVLKVTSLLKKLGFEIKTLNEEIINEKVKHFYMDKNAMHVYEKFKGTPVIYGLLAIKRNAA